MLLFTSEAPSMGSSTQLPPGASTADNADSVTITAGGIAIATRVGPLARLRQRERMYWLQAPEHG